ncbi:MAG: AmmeMemoRadiSam system protein A [Spirochaetales bacterium]|nr:AmmeMemoRadiSam system protein A [Spirochaetales bacterium]
MREYFLTAEERRELLGIARMAIASKFEGSEPSNPSPSGGLAAPAGAFVTLKKRGELRGCVGRIVGGPPLVETVARMAEDAAFGDPRFPPLQATELPDITIEISVLTPLEPCKADDVHIGVHGALLSVGFHRAVFLPQVATEQGWNLLDFFSHLSRKAGLPFDAWRSSEAEIHRFRALVFGEGEQEDGDQRADT